MLDRRIAAFDIETIPDPDMGRRLLGLVGSDADIVHEMVRRRLEESDGRSEYPQLPFHRVVCVCASVIDPATGAVTIANLGGDALDERSHLEGFFRLTAADGFAARLVSWNGGGFDVPVLRYRAMLHGIAAPDFYRQDPERGGAPYQSRYHDLHVDLMDVLSGYGASARVGLATLGSALGLPAKSFLDRTIYDHVLEGDGASVVEYCKLDTLLTLLLYLVWALHTGRISREELRRYLDATRRTVDAQPHAGWREIGASLAGWPAWLE